MMGIVTTNSPCPMISKSCIHEKERGGFHIKMAASQVSLPENKVKAIVEKLAGDRSLKEPPICIFSECNLGISHIKHSCDNMPLKIRCPNISAQKVLGEDVSEVIKVSSYQCTPKELQEKMMSGGWNNVKEDVDMETTNCEVKPVVHMKQNLPKEAKNILGEESSESCQSSMTTEKGQELEDTTELISKSCQSPKTRDRGEIFRERDLHFGEEDWPNLPLWCSSEGDAEGDMTFYSPSGSETSSSLSTLELSNSSCRSEASSFSGRENELLHSLYSSLGSINASIFSPSFMCKSSLPATHLQKQVIFTDVLSHGYKEIFTAHPQTKPYNQSQFCEYLKVPEGMMVMPECSEVGKINQIASLLKYKEISPSTSTNLESCDFPVTGVTMEKDDSRPPNELGASLRFLLSTEECLGGLAATEVLLAKTLTPEINSDISEDGNDAASQLILRTEALKENGNIRIDDGANHFTVTDTDSCYTKVGDHGSIVKSTSVLDLPIQRESSDVSVSLGSCLPIVDRDDNMCIHETSSASSMDTGNTMASKNLQFTVQSVSSNDQGTQFSSTEETFLRSNVASCIDPQFSKMHVDVPVKSVASAVQLQHEKLNTKGSSIHAPRNYVNRKTKSFSFSGCPDHPIQTRESPFAIDGCKVCGNMTASHVGCLNPTVKHPETYLAGSSSRGTLEVPSFHPLHDNTSVWSPERASMKIVQGSHYLCSPGYIHPRSKGFRKGVMRCNHRLNMDLGNGVLRKPLSPIPKRSGGSIIWKHEQVPEKLPISTPETERSRPSASTSTSHPLISQGLLHCSCKDGFPYYTFSLNESEKALVAKKWKLNNRGRKDFDWLYTFHSGPDNKTILNLLKKNRSKWVAPPRKDEHILGLVGHMRVSSSLCPEINSFGSLEITVETEFVLFGVNIEHIKKRPARQTNSTEKSILFPDQLDHKRIPNENCGDSCSTSITSSTQVADNISCVPSYMASPNHAIKKKMTRELTLSQPSQQSFSEFFESSPMSRSVDGNAACVENWGNWGISDAELCLSQPFSPHLELTAIVIRTPSSETQTVNSGTGKDTVSKNPVGWGLKFLDKSFHSSRSTHPHHQDDSCKSECSNNLAMSPTPSSAGCTFDEQSPGPGLEGHLSCKRQCKTSITALVPADMHGLPKLKSSGPSPLIERWRLGGSCDCGGWDMGCALTLLHNRKQRRNTDLIETNSKAEDYNSLYVLSKGESEDTPALTMTAVADGLYSVSFQSQLTTLQAFSIVLSMLHSRAEMPIPPAMHNKNNN